MNIIVVDDHPLFRDALRSMFRVGLPSARIEEAGSIEAAKRVLADRPGMDLIVLDLTMDDVKGFEGLMALRICFPRIPILVCSALDEPRIIREAIRLGAAGFVPKSAGKSVYMEALDQILAGAIYMPDSVASCSKANISEPIPAAALIATLTPAQMNVLTMIKRGKINKQIAYDLGIGDSMVKAHVSEIMRKLGVQNRTQVALCATALDFNRAGAQELSKTP
ncbi:DNA-binding response regulator, NarL/FixJ family, contains REC and HTH domains [Methylobacterium sp. UNC300MFChir4.1]|uniref:response regulator n=1 Tax=Methylobacterium sp. UNC300MFChir4.1 TaxID=1502747 RepID=UPI0008D5A5AE|nr:response regulator transcription factor [Methylobacterium sp. UNC300MFChir4.1]SEP39480.1 DNA-binding response regulator, NarL/FixJ family, contains REC and HTH domains [Methylobacterium sp. UNC300MFChir4.1]